MDLFADPQAVARYAEGPPRLVPGFDGLQRMAEVLIAERAPDDARLLVLGAGGGLELRAFAQARPGWTFDGVDPAAEMLRLAERTLGPLAARARLHEGYIDDAPEGPFDAATCLLTLHFVTPEARRRTLAAVRATPQARRALRGRALELPAGGGRAGALAVALRGLRGRLRCRARADGDRPRGDRRAVDHPHAGAGTRRSCARPASRTSPCSTPVSPSAAGWPTPDTAHLHRHQRA